MGLIYKKIDLTPIWDKPPVKVKSEKKYYIKKEKKIKDNSFNEYKKKVDEITEANKLLVEGIETRAWKGNHIDHKLSIKWGFYNSIDPATIAHPDNLRMLWWEDNWKKGGICFVDDKNKWIAGDLKLYTNRNQK